MRRTVWVIACLLASARAEAQLSWSLADGNQGWPSWARDAVTKSMNEAVALYKEHGTFERHLTANYNAGVPTAQANYSGWIDFGGQSNTRTALHEIAHALGVGTYRPFNGGQWDDKGAAGKLVKLFEGQAATLSTGGSHFWPYGLNYDNEDNPGARERHVKLVAALRFDMGIVGDSDRDGLPDDWEQLHFDGLGEGAEGDPDLDGIRNLDEYGSDADPRAAAPVRDGQRYRVRTQISGRVLAFDDAVRVLADAETQWTAHYAGEGFFRFSADDGRVLQLDGADLKAGKPLTLGAWTGALSQQWRVVGGAGARPDHWQLANRETGRVADCLDGAERAPVQQYPYLGELPQQFWKFERAGEAADAASATDLPRADAGSRDAGMRDASVRDASVRDASVRDASVGDARVRDAELVDASVRDAADAADEGGEEPSVAQQPRPEDGGCALGGSGQPSLLTLLLLAAYMRRRR